MKCSIHLEIRPDILKLQALSDAVTDVIMASLFTLYLLLLAALRWCKLSIVYPQPTTDWLQVQRDQVLFTNILKSKPCVASVFYCFCRVRIVQIYLVFHSSVFANQAMKSMPQKTVHSWKLWSFKNWEHPQCWIAKKNLI